VAIYFIFTLLFMIWKTIRDHGPETVVAHGSRSLRPWFGAGKESEGYEIKIG
jgi:hypothetical protein